MSDDQKAVYKEKAKGGDVQIAKRSCGAKVDTATNKPPGSRSGLFTSQGVPTSLYEQERKEKTKELTNMRLRIANLVQKLPLMTGMQILHENCEKYLIFFINTSKRLLCFM